MMRPYIGPQIDIFSVALVLTNTLRHQLVGVTNYPPSNGTETAVFGLSSLNHSLRSGLGQAPQSRKGLS